jgi:hypothetical protein
MPLSNPIILNNFKRVIDPNEKYLLNEEATTSWASMMKGVKSGGSGPWSLVATEYKKVIDQEINIKTKEILPAAFEAMRRKHPRATIHIEDAGGSVVWINKK